MSLGVVVKTVSDLWGEDNVSFALINCDRSEDSLSLGVGENSLSQGVKTMYHL